MHQQNSDKPANRSFTPRKGLMLKTSHRPPPHEPRPDDGTDPYRSDRSCIMYPDGAEMAGVEVAKPKE